MERIAHTLTKNHETLLCFTQHNTAFTSYPTSTRACSLQARRAPSPVRSHRSSRKLAETGFVVPSPSPLSQPPSRSFQPCRQLALSMATRRQRRAQQPYPPTRVESYPHPRLVRAASCSCLQQDVVEQKKWWSQKMPARMHCRGVA